MLILGHAENLLFLITSFLSKIPFITVIAGFIVRYIWENEPSPEIPFNFHFFCWLLAIARCNGGIHTDSTDDVQKDHLKSYGVAFWFLKNGGEVDWLLNYRGGSFMTRYDKKIENECNVRGVSCQF